MANCLLSDGTTILTLPEDCYLDPDPDLMETGLRMQTEISAAGTAIVQLSAQTNGWPVTLKNQMPIARSLVQDILTMARLGAPMTLTLPDLRAYGVVFNYPNAIEAEPLLGYVPAEDDEPIQFILNFLIMITP